MMVISHQPRKETCINSCINATSFIRDMDELAEKIRVLDEVLHKLSFAISHKNDLHIAAAKGDVESVTNILEIHPELAEELDSHKSSPLHIAAAKGDIDMTTKLLEKAPHMCWSRDSHGMNPFHVAAVKGHVDVLEKLVIQKPFAALEKLDRGETALHLCVKHDRLDALKVLVGNLDELIGVEDNNGESLLHWAVRYYQNVQIVTYLMSSDCIDKINKNSINSKGEKALDLLKQSRRYKQKYRIALDIENLFKSRSTIKSLIQKFGEPPKKDLRSKSNSIMVVAVLIATMAFQAAVSPPGGVWQDHTPPHKAGESVMAFYHPNVYKVFMRSSSLAFVTSLSTILLLVSGLPSRHRIFMWTLTVIMWASLTAIAVTYTTSIVVVTPRRQRPSHGHVIKTGIVGSLVVIGILFILTSVRMWNVWAQKILFQILLLISFFEPYTVKLRVLLNWLTGSSNPTSHQPA